MSDPLELVVIESQQPAQYAVIWLHGLGADGHDFAPIVPQLQLPQANIRFIFPHAPQRPVTLNFGMPCRAWFDLSALSRHEGLDIAGAKESVQQVQQLMAQQQVAPENIIVAGFSQGGAIALLAGLTYPEPIGGILALSTFLPDPIAYPMTFHPANQETPILLCHGVQDPLIPLTFAKESLQDLQAKGYTVQWQEYPTEHGLCLQEIEDIGTWLASRTSNSLGTCAK